AVELVLRPLLSFVDYHSLQHEEASAGFRFLESEGKVTAGPVGGGPLLHFLHNGMSVTETGHWYRNFEYAIEKERGFDFSEDLFQPCEMGCDLSRGPAIVFASTEEGTAFDYDGAE